MLEQVQVFLRQDELDFPVLEPEDIGAEDLLFQSSGKILGADDQDTEIEIGSFRVFYADLSSGEVAGYSAQDVLDGHHATVSFMSLFINGSVEHTRATEKAIGFPPIDRNLLVLDRLEILPEYRGHGLGEKIIRTLIRRYGQGAELVAIKPFPLQFEAGPPSPEFGARMQLGLFSQDQRLATRTLRAYYQRLGFVPVSRTDLMVCPAG